MVASRFITLGGPVSAQIEVKRSRFLCDLVPVRGDVFAGRAGGPVAVEAADGSKPSDAEAQARAVVEAARRRSWDARHHCSAFVLGADGQVRRSSDDGEPSGTAGAPMLDALVGAGVTDVVAVVTRWFGGTLLGAGGLVRAYGDAVRAALDGAVGVGYGHRLLVDAAVDVGQVGRVENALRVASGDGEGLEVESIDYAIEAACGRAVMHLAVSGAGVERAGGLLAELTGASVELVPRGEAWVRLAP